MRKNILKITAALLAISFIWIGCSNDNKKAQALFGQDNTNTNQDTSAIGIRMAKVKDIFTTVPGTVQIMTLLKAAGSRYTIDIPADPTIVGNYSTVKGQALNLGIYAADLAYAGLYNQKNDASLYLQSANKLSTSLGIPDAFNDKVISRIDANMTNQDSLLTIIMQDFWNTDTFLKKNSRQEVSAYLVAGGWVEGMYIATQIASKSTTGTGVANEVAYMKVTLQDLVDMLRTYPKSQGLQDISAKLSNIQSLYSGVEVDVKQPVPMDKTILTADQLKAITDAVASLRKEITAGS